MSQQVRKSKGTCKRLPKARVCSEWGQTTLGTSEDSFTNVGRPIAVKPDEASRSRTLLLPLPVPEEKTPLPRLTVAGGNLLVGFLCRPKRVGPQPLEADGCALRPHSEPGGPAGEPQESTAEGIESPKGRI